MTGAAASRSRRRRRAPRPPRGAGGGRPCARRARSGRSRSAAARRRARAPASRSPAAPARRRAAACCTCSRTRRCYDDDDVELVATIARAGRAAMELARRFAASAASASSPSGAEIARSRRRRAMREGVGSCSRRRRVVGSASSPRCAPRRRDAEYVAGCWLGRERRAPPSGRPQRLQLADASGRRSSPTCAPRRRAEFRPLAPAPRARFPLVARARSSLRPSAGRRVARAGAGVAETLQRLAHPMALASTRCSGRRRSGGRRSASACSPPRSRRWTSGARDRRGRPRAYANPAAVRSRHRGTSSRGSRSTARRAVQSVPLPRHRRLARRRRGGRDRLPSRRGAPPQGRSSSRRDHRGGRGATLAPGRPRARRAQPHDDRRVAEQCSSTRSSPRSARSSRARARAEQPLTGISPSRSCCRGAG